MEVLPIFVLVFYFKVVEDRTAEFRGRFVYADFVLNSEFLLDDMHDFLRHMISETTQIIRTESVFEVLGESSLEFMREGVVVVTDLLEFADLRLVVFRLLQLLDILLRGTRSSC